jgi:hypothetical protein
MISKFIDEAVTLNNLPASPAICWHWTLYQTITFEVWDWGREKIKKKLNNLLNDCQSWQIYVTVIHLEVRTSHALAPEAWELSKVCRYVGCSLSVKLVLLDEYSSWFLLLLLLLLLIFILTGDNQTNVTWTKVSLGSDFDLTMFFRSLFRNSMLVTIVEII